MAQKQNKFIEPIIITAAPIALATIVFFINWLGSEILDNGCRDRPEPTMVFKSVQDGLASPQVACAPSFMNFGWETSLIIQNVLNATFWILILATIPCLIVSIVILSKRLANKNL